MYSKVRHKANYYKLHGLRNVMDDILEMLHFFYIPHIYNMQYLFIIQGIPATFWRYHA